MSPESLARLFDYDTAAARELLDALRDQPATEEHVRAVFAHMLAARRVWIERLQNDGRSETPVWPSLDWDECEALIDENDEAYTAYLAEVSASDLEAPVSYQNSAGREFANRPVDILMHVIVHGGYHRGQIAQSVRRAGGEPINTDYITHLRR